MNAKEFVDSLFEGYEKTAALTDFKEELLGNLNAKIENFVKKGMSTEEAFTKASAELGDVSTLANDLSLKKRKEVFEEVYMDIRKYMSTGRVAAYVVFGVVTLFGIIIALITLFATKSVGISTHLDLAGFFGTLLPFLTTAIIGFTFLGVTQETSSMYPVSKKRGAWYATAAGLIAFGLLTMPILFFGVKFAGDMYKTYFGEAFSITIPFSFISIDHFESIIPIISLMIPFVLPGIGLLVFLILTEKDRLKPWAKEFHTKAVEREMEMWQDPATAARFGLFSGAIWIFAVGIFILLGFIIGFKFSWLVFIFAVAIQLLVQGFMSKGTGKG
jgi:membrane-associated HD superfamily phosphohydrolase